MLGGDTVIAKDVDSKRQLTEPLKSFIYAPEPAGGERKEEGEREGRVHNSKSSFEVQPSHLISVLQDQGD